MSPLPTHVTVALRELALRFFVSNRDWLRLEVGDGTPAELAFAGRENAELLLGPDSLGSGRALWVTNVRSEHDLGRNVVYIIRTQPDGSLDFCALL